MLGCWPEALTARTGSAAAGDPGFPASSSLQGSDSVWGAELA